MGTKGWTRGDWEKYSAIRRAIYTETAADFNLPTYVVAYLATEKVRRMKSGRNLICPVCGEIIPAGERYWSTSCQYGPEGSLRVHLACHQQIQPAAAAWAETTRDERAARIEAEMAAYLETRKR
jgi:hypothetical protein